MTISLESIVFLLESKGIDFSIIGGTKSVKNLAAIATQVENSLCYYVGNDPGTLTGVKNSILFCKSGIKFDTSKNNTLIYTEFPQICFYLVSTLFETKKKPVIDYQTIIDQCAEIGKGASIGPFCVIEECIIGENVILDAGVKVFAGTVIGNNVHIQPNSVIGATGVMWAWDSVGQKIPFAQTGKVIIEDDVFIGSNITVSRGAFSNKPSIIGKGTMIAHGTTIGHGAVIGVSNHFANNVAIAGSVTTGENCFFGSGSSVRPHIKLPKNIIVGAGAVVVKDFYQEGLVLIGNPAREMKTKKEKVSGVPSPF